MKIVFFPFKVGLIFMISLYKSLQERHVREGVKIPHSRMTKTCWETLETKQVIKGHLYHLVGVSGYYVMYRQRVQ